MKPIRFAVIQSGYAVFGTGHTKDEAIMDAVASFEGSQEELEERLDRDAGERVDGAFRVIDSADDEFDGYMENQGGYIKRDGEWYEEAK